MTVVNRFLLAAAALACAASLTAGADEIFERKPGLWRITMSSPGGHSPHTADQCLAADTDSKLARIAVESIKSTCSKIENHKVGNTYVTDSVCTIGNRKTASRAVTTPNGENQYHTVITTHYEGEAAPNAAAKVFNHEGRWVGACPATMKPGDQILQVGPQLPGGMKSNLLGPP